MNDFIMAIEFVGIEMVVTFVIGTFTMIQFRQNQILLTDNFLWMYTYMVEGYCNINTVI